MRSKDREFEKNRVAASLQGESYVVNFMWT